MNASVLLMASYTFVALLCIDNTLREGNVNARWDLDRVVGLLLCLIWPVTLAAVALVAYQQRRAD